MYQNYWGTSSQLCFIVLLLCLPFQPQCVHQVCRHCVYTPCCSCINPPFLVNHSCIMTNLFKIWDQPERSTFKHKNHGNSQHLLILKPYIHCKSTNWTNLIPFIAPNLWWFSTFSFRSYRLPQLIKRCLTLMKAMAWLPLEPQSLPFFTLYFPKISTIIPQSMGTFPRKALPTRLLNSLIISFMYTICLAHLISLEFFFTPNHYFCIKSAYYAIITDAIKTG